MHTDSIDVRSHLLNLWEEGWSVIPLKGMGSEAKQPNIKTWKRFQKRRPTQTERESWQPMPAYGVIMGTVSKGIFAIDFDTPTRYADFCEKLPELAASYTVRTRKGFHVYLCATFPVKTARFDNGDLISEGSYVVGAGSIITQVVDGKLTATQYKVHQKTGILKITKSQYKTLQHHLGIEGEQETRNRDQNQGQSIQVEKLITQYNKGIRNNTRNNTLYRVAVRAKQSNINQANTIATLAEHHARTPTKGQHPSETYDQRYTEAIRTIESAYRTAGTSAIQPQAQDTTIIERQLPNNLREVLLQTTAHKNNTGAYINASPVIARLIEGLHRNGYLGTTIHEKTLKEVCDRYSISNSSLKKILKGRYTQEIQIKQISYSERNTPPVGEYERKNKKTTYYKLPSLQDLLQRFKVDPQTTDILSEDDLRSNKAYLQAMHREFIRRCGGNTSTTYCAERLSITERTILTYDKDLHIHKTAFVHYEAVGWHNVDDLDFPAQDEKGITPGIWLQRDDGKRFPAIRGIALSQLKDGANLILCTQKPSARYLPDMGIAYHDVWWVAPDGSRWGGGEYDVPPQASIVYSPPTAIATVTEPTIVQKQHRINDIEGRQPDYRSAFEARDHQRVVHITQQVQQMRQTQAFKVEPRINESLTLIKGIGDRIDDQLSAASIERMTDMISVGAETIASIFHYNVYINAKTTQYWIDQAKVLLGLVKQSDAEQQQVAQTNVIKQEQRRYRAAYKRLQVFVQELIAIENAIGGCFPQLNHLNKLLSERERDTQFYHERTQLLIQRETSLTLQRYGERVAFFASQSDDWLRRWGYGEKSEWEKRLKRVKIRSAYWQQDQ